MLENIWHLILTHGGLFVAVGTVFSASILFFTLHDRYAKLKVKRVRLRHFDESRSEAYCAVDVHNPRSMDMRVLRIEAQLGRGRSATRIRAIIKSEALIPAKDRKEIAIRLSQIDDPSEIRFILLYDVLDRTCRSQRWPLNEG